MDDPIAGMFTDLLKGIGTITGLVGAGMIAMCAVGCGPTGFWFFLVSSITWGLAAFRMGETSLFILQAAFVLINVIGIYNWS